LKARVTLYPNDEARLSVFPERLPKDYLRDPLRSESEGLENKGKVENCPPEQRSPLFSGCGETAFNIKSKVDTVHRKPKLFLSRNGRRQILRAGSCFDKGELTERLLLTGTLPGRCQEAHKALAEYSTYASKTLTNWLTRRSAGCKWMYTWEFQDRGAIHIHLVVELPLSVSAYVKEHFKDEWNRIITSISEKSGVNLRKRHKGYNHPEEKTQADCRVCEREPSRYISKYISKGSKNGFGRWRYPPKTWYQISRSLLSELRERTQVYEASGLSYRQALLFIENTTYTVSTGSTFGHRRFKGSTLCWSAYSYRKGFTIQEFDEKMTNTKSSLSPTDLIAKHAITTSKDYPQSRAYLRSKDWGAIGTRIETGIATESEMLLYIEAVMISITTVWSSLNRKESAARFLQRSHNWWEAKFGYRTITSEFKMEIDNICEDSLTA
jgi:hypothetical protein